MTTVSLLLISLCDNILLINRRYFSHRIRLSQLQYIDMSTTVPIYLSMSKRLRCCKYSERRRILSNARVDSINASQDTTGKSNSHPSYTDAQCTSLSVASPSSAPPTIYSITHRCCYSCCRIATQLTIALMFYMLILAYHICKIK